LSSRFNPYTGTDDLQVEKPNPGNEAKSEKSVQPEGDE
jgi:hypothetical protein